MTNIKKLQNFFVDAKIPRIQRDAIPLMVSTKGIIWVVGHRIAEWCKVTEHSKRIIKVKWVVKKSKSSETLTSES
jgi:tRNA(Ile)-lysidine synthase